MALASLLCGIGATLGNILSFIMLFVGAESITTDRYDNIIGVGAGATAFAVIAMILSILGTVFGVIGIVKNAKAKKRLGKPITGVILSGVAFIFAISLLIVYGGGAAALNSWYR